MPAPDRHKTRLVLLGFVIASLALSACGIKGSLKTPPPLWGESKVETETQNSDSELPPPTPEEEDSGYLEY